MVQGHALQQVLNQIARPEMSLAVHSDEEIVVRPDTSFTLQFLLATNESVENIVFLIPQLTIERRGISAIVTFEPIKKEELDSFNIPIEQLSAPDPSSVRVHEQDIDELFVILEINSRNGKSRKFEQQTSRAAFEAILVFLNAPPDDDRNGEPDLREEDFIQPS